MANGTMQLPRAHHLILEDCKRLSIPVINTPSGPGQGDLPLDPQIEIFRIFFAVHDLKEEQPSDQYHEQYRQYCEQYNTSCSFFFKLIH